MNESRPPIPLPDAAPLAAPDGFEAQLAAVGVTLAPEALARVGHYLALLLAMNERMNLTAVTSPDEAWTRHALDALTLAPLLPPSGRVVDVGSGGGVPAIPLAVARPDLRFTLVEATQKKCSFLARAAGALGLTNVRVEASRAELLARDPSHRGAYDAVTARAVARLAELVGWTAPFARRGASLLLVKGARADEELADAAEAMRRERVTHVETRLTPTGRVVVLRKA